MTREVKPFGDGGAHITLPSELEGEVVEVRRIDWDEDLDGNVFRLHNSQYVTQIESAIGVDRFACPTVRERIATSRDEIELGLVDDSRNEDLDPGDPYTVAASDLENGLFAIGDSGYGRCTLIELIAWQQAVSEESGRPFCFIGSGDTGIDNLSALLETFGLPYTTIDASNTPTEDELEERIENAPFDAPLLIRTPLNRRQFRDQQIESMLDILANVSASGTKEKYSVFIDEFPSSACGVDKLEEWGGSGIAVFTSLQYVEQLPDDMMAWVAENPNLMCFHLTEKRAREMVHILDVDSPGKMVDKVQHLDHHRALMCGEDQSVIAVHHEIPPI